MGEFKAEDVRDGLWVRASGVDGVVADCGHGRCRVRWKSGGSAEMSTWRVAASVNAGFYTVLGYADRSGNGHDVTPPTQRSGRRFDGVTIRSDSACATGIASWDEGAGSYAISWRFENGEDSSRMKKWRTEAQIVHHMDIGSWRIIEPEAPTLSPRDASRRAIDEAIRGFRDQPFAAAIQAVLVAMAESKAVVTADDIECAVAACRAWEKRRRALGIGNRKLTDAEAISCKAAALDAVWRKSEPTRGEDAVKATEAHYERARSL